MTMKSKKRPHIVQVTLSSDELAALKVHAEVEGVSMTSFIRQLVIKRVMKAPVVLVVPRRPETSTEG